MAVHESLRLLITNEKFFIEPLDKGSKDILVIDRVTKEISLQSNNGDIPASAVAKDICGIMGIIRLVAGPYLIVITKKSKVGEINGHTVWKVAGTEVLSYMRTTTHLTEQQVQDNKTYLNMLDHMLSVESYYFCTDFDLTHTLQRLYNTSPDFISMPLHERADQRFLWNGYLLRELAQQGELSSFCLPIVLGFVTVRRCTIKNQTFTYILVSRRSCLRAGVRYYIRGVDQEGHVANFVETEQIIEYDGTRASFVQTRGSVPLFWSQRPNLKYKPDPDIYRAAPHMDGFQRHFASQIYHYGTQVIVSLLDHKGKEDLLVKGLADAVAKTNNPDIRLEAFDFHHECRKMRWHRLSILVDRLAKEQKKFGYFMIRGGNVFSLQEGVFRTNCIDCLDRTNVVQSLLARVSLHDQLQEIGILQAGERVEDQVEFEYTFKNLWADNADALAKQYAGTGALKTDFTRTGARTKLGLLKDGYNSGIRYILNNFYDGFRQDSIDLVVGNYTVEDNEGLTRPSPLRQERDWKFYALPTILIVAFSMCVISVLIPDDQLSEQVMYVLFWGGASVASLGAIYMYGNDFVNQPKLAQAKYKTD